MTTTPTDTWTYADLRIGDGIAEVTYDRTARANALSSDSVRDLRQAIEASADYEDVRLVVLRTAGPGAFCAGADVQEMRSLDAPGAERFIRGLHSAFRAVRQHPAPVIAVVQGACLGAGLELMISCDFALVSDRATFGMPEPFVGLPSVIEAALLPHAIGLMRTRDLLFTGDAIDAENALRSGLVTSVSKPEALEEAVRAKCAQLVRHSPVALRLQKQLMNRWMNLPLDEAVEAGVKALALAFATGEPARAIDAYWSDRSG